MEWEVGRAGLFADYYGLSDWGREARCAFRVLVSRGLKLGRIHIRNKKRRTTQPGKPWVLSSFYAGSRAFVCRHACSRRCTV